MIDPEIVQIIIQGGAVGILLAFGVGGYLLAKLAINKGFDFVGNHMTHLTETLVQVKLTLGRLDQVIEHLVKKDEE